MVVVEIRASSSNEEGEELTLSMLCVKKGEYVGEM